MCPSLTPVVKTAASCRHASLLRSHAAAFQSEVTGADHYRELAIPKPDIRESRRTAPSFRTNTDKLRKPQVRHLGDASSIDVLDLTGIAHVPPVRTLRQFVTQVRHGDVRVVPFEHGGAMSHATMQARSPAPHSRGQSGANARAYRHCPSRVSWPSFLMASYASEGVAKVPTIAPSFHRSTRSMRHFSIGLRLRPTNTLTPQGPKLAARSPVTRLLLLQRNKTLGRQLGYKLNDL